MRYLNLAITSILCATLTACAVGPNYHRPSALPKGMMPTHFKEAAGWKTASPQDLADRGEWWEIFHDEKLNQLEDRLNLSNQNVNNAYQNYRQAQDLVDEAVAGLFPTLSANMTATAQKQPASINNNNNNNINNINNNTSGVNVNNGGNINHTHSLALNASWVLDIWGQTRRTIEANADAAEASRALFLATRLAQQSALANTYFQMRGLDTDQVILDRTVRADATILKLTQDQYHAGIVALSDVVQASETLETAKAQATNNGILRAQYEHAIAVLMGVPPETVTIAPNPLYATPPHIPVSLPSTLLERRPDVAEAERTMAQNNAEIGEAEAAFFPDLTLSGSITGAANGAALEKLFSIPVVGWSYGAQLSELLFDGGLRSATVAAAAHGYDASVAAYRQTVLSAFQNVDDNLVSLRLLAKEAVVQNAAAHDAKVALQLVLLQYKSGIVAYANVMIAQISALSAEKTAADVNTQRMSSAVNLIAALGGGWG